MASRAGAATAESQGAPESQDAPTATDRREKGALARLTRLWTPRWKLTVPGGVFRRDVTKLLGRKRVRFWGSL